MKKLAITLALAAVFTLGACNIKKQHVEVKQDRVVAVAPKLSLESLDARVSDLERSRASARAAVRRAAKSPQ